jgi:hypothetical protein
MARALEHAYIEKAQRGDVEPHGAHREFAFLK